jgi:hypothetical protein
VPVGLPDGHGGHPRTRYVGTADASTRPAHGLFPTGPGPGYEARHPERAPLHLLRSGATIEVPTARHSRRVNVLGFLNCNNALVPYRVTGKVETSGLVEGFDQFRHHSAKKPYVLLEHARRHRAQEFIEQLPKWGKKDGSSNTCHLMHQSCIGSSSCGVACNTTGYHCQPVPLSPISLRRSQRCSHAWVRHISFPSRQRKICKTLCPPPSRLRQRALCSQAGRRVVCLRSTPPDDFERSRVFLPKRSTKKAPAAIPRA